MGATKLSYVARFIETAPANELPSVGPGRILAAVAALMDDEREWTPITYNAIAHLAQRNAHNVGSHVRYLVTCGYLECEWRRLHPGSGDRTYRHFYRLSDQFTREARP